MAIPLKAFAAKLCLADLVHVELHHGARGQSVNYVHFIFGSRYIAKNDQHAGVQKDVPRFYVASTRAKLELHMYR